MKNLLGKFLSILMIGCVALSAVSCSGGDDVHVHDIKTYAGKEATCTEAGWSAYETCKSEGCSYTTYKEIPATGHSYIIGACERCGLVATHLKSTKIMQAKQTDANTGKEYDAEFIYAYDIEDIRFLQYRVGKIENCFIQPLMVPVENFTGMEKTLFEIENLTSKSISKGISNSISTTQSVSVAKSAKETISWDFSVGAEVTTSKKVGINVGISKGVSFGASAEKEVSTSINAAVKYGKSNEKATSTEIANEATNETNNSFNVEEVHQAGLSISYEVNMEKMPKGLFYALCLVADIDIYQIIGFNMSTGELYTTYFMSYIQGNPAMTVLSAETAAFEIPPKYHIAPITEINVELEEIKMISVNFEENGGDEITNILIGENQCLNEIPVPKRQYHTFVGWYTSEDFDARTLVREDTIFTENTTLYAKWERNKVKLTFDSNGGTNIPDQIINQGDSYTLPSSFLDNIYEFKGWFFEGNGMTYKPVSIIVEKDMHFVAQWEEKKILEGVNEYDRDTRLTSPDGKYIWISDNDNVNASRGLYDTIILKDYLGYDLEALKNYGFKTIKIEFTIHIKERDDGYQQIYLADNWKDATKKYYTYWETHDTSTKLTERDFSGTVLIDIDELADVIYFTYEARGDGNDSWYNEGLEVKFTAIKEAGATAELK